MQSAKTTREHELEKLKREHRELDARIAELERRRFLSPDEELEIKRLKRLKLKKKDAITHLAGQQGG